MNRLLLPLYCLLLTGPLVAQEAVVLNFVNIGTAVANKSITSIAEDGEGFRWFGTIDAGVFRYDGINCRQYDYRPGRATGLNSNVVFAILVDDDGDLWVGTNEGINRYDRARDRFERLPLIGTDGRDYPVPVRSLGASPGGELLIGTMYNGLFRLPAGDTAAVRVATPWNAENSLIINELRRNARGEVLAATNLGLLRYFAADKILLPHRTNAPAAPPEPAAVTSSPYVPPRADSTTERYVRHSLESIDFDADGGTWLGTTNQGVLHVDAHGELRQFPVTDKRVMSLVFTDAGRVLAGTENDGLLELDRRGRVRHRYLADRFNPRSIGSNSVWELYEDRRGRVWQGYYNKGVSVYDRLHDKFSSIVSQPNQPHSLRAASVTGLAETTDGQLWITTDGGGLDIADLPSGRFLHAGSGQTEHLSGLTSDNLLCVLIDRRGGRWVGSWGGGLFHLPPGQRRFRNFTNATTGGGLPSDHVMYLSEDDRGRVWCSTFGGGVAYYDPATGDFNPCNGEEFLTNNLTHTESRVVLATQDGSIWLGTNGGLYRLRDRREGGFDITAYREQMTTGREGHSSINHILSLYESGDSLLYVGTDGGGLFRYEFATDRITHQDIPGEVSDQTIRAILEDTAGNLWFSGKRGITALLPTDGAAAVTYSTDDGLLAENFNNNAALRARSGRLYFGSYEGINHFVPGQLVANDEPPRVHLTDLKLSNRSTGPGDPDSPLERDIDVTESITLGADQSVLTLEYVGISLTRPEKTTYAYRLVGFDRDWQYVGTRRDATYTSLPAGDYVFEVRAANNDGVWSEEPARLRIRVLPPWYLSWPAYLGYALLAGLLIWWLRRVDQQRYVQEQAVGLERDKRLQEEALNEKKLQFFTNISHEFRTPLTLIVNPLRELINQPDPGLSQATREKLGIVYRNSDKLSRLVDELMDFRKLRASKPEVRPEEFDLAARVAAITEHFRAEAHRRDITLDAVREEETLDCYLDPGMLEKILFNLISNAFKVTDDQGRIDVSVGAAGSGGGDRVFVSVTDTGVGLDPADLERIFDRFHRVDNLQQQYYGSTGIGLEVVKTLVEHQGGEVRVSSRRGEGSTFTVVFPRRYTGAGPQEQSQGVAPAAVLAQPETLPPPPAPAAPAAAPADGSAKRPTHTLLIVEDNTELRDYLREALRSYFTVIVARNGQQGLELARDKQPDIILTDVVMPVMDGLELCRQVKADIKTSHIPLLMLTARTLVQDRLNGIDSGADGYLAKPFDIQVLVSTLRQLISSRQLLFDKYYGGMTTKAAEATTTADAEFMNKLLGVINERLNDPSLSVEALSEEFFLSRSQLYRKTKTLTGVSVNQFVRRVRLERAHELLKQDNGPISEVAYRVGFTSPSYFAKCFKEQYGCLPNEVAGDSVSQ